MGRFEPSADPRDAIQRGFYVPRPGRAIGDELAASFEIKPSASQLLVGGVGSGKTTQLLVARDKLEASGDVHSVYIDVSLERDPRSLSWYELAAAVGLELASRLSPGEGERAPLPRERVVLDDVAHGNFEEDPTAMLVTALRAVHGALARRKPHVVVLVDALDRMVDLKGFQRIAAEAVPLLRSAGIGVILVGPLTAIYGLGGTITDRFDRFHHLPTIDVQNDEEGRTFLREVLRVRDVGKLLSDDACGLLASLSGGVLRDLIALTQLAGEEAYVEGADRVEVPHVDAAADVFGRKQMAALDSAQMESLQRVRTDGTFVETSEKDLALLSTRRVLEYPRGNPRFAVHPTMEPLLAQLAGFG